MTQPQTARFVIYAKAQDGFIQQTRVNIGSALALARSWNECGYTNIQVLSPSGDRVCPEKYRETILAGERYAC